MLCIILWFIAVLLFLYSVSHLYVNLLFDALCCLVDFFFSKDSGLVLLLIRYLYLISEFILDLYVLCDGSLMSKN